MTQGKRMTLSSKNGDVTKEFRIKEVENGYILSVETSGYKKNKAGEKEWFNDTKEYVTKELDGEEDKVEEQMAALISSIEKM